MGSGGKAPAKTTGAAIGTAGGGGGHADGPGGVAGGAAGPVDVSAPVTMVAPVSNGPVAVLYTGVSKVSTAMKSAKPTAKGIVGFLGAAAPVAKQFDAMYAGDPAYQGLTEEQKQQLWTTAKDATKGYLESANKAELQKAAAATGFKYPHLIGKDDPKGSALSFVLNPFYSSPNAVATKGKIQAKALSHYGQLPDEDKPKADAETEALAAQAQEGDPVPGEAVAGAGASDAPTVKDPSVGGAPEASTGPIETAQEATGAPSSEPSPTPSEPAPPAPIIVELPKLVANIKNSFTDLLKSLAGLALTKQVTKELPSWRGGDAVRNLVFHHEGDAGHLGGVHEKHIYRSPDGQRWLFKPDKKGKGAVAAAEEAAAEIARRAGMPAVEVRRIQIGNQTGSIQPMVANVSTQGLSADPGKWSQQQQAAVMAQHVVDWVLGDHDGNHANFIMVGNAPVRIDRGQSFKFFGQDQLALDYTPNAAHGAPPHAAIALYQAAKAGKASVNPLLLAPVIQAMECIPEAEYRAMLRPVAEAGVKSKQVEWYKTVRNRAAIKTGTANPGDKEIAETFADMALQRKAAVRPTFEGFISSCLGQPFEFPMQTAGQGNAASAAQPATP